MAPGDSPLKNKRAFRAALLAHFDRHARPMPWRSGRDAYRVVVSEFMLQQTRAETVAPYYERWLRRFPGWDALADAGEDDVLRAWQGLGYYARARNLHRTARIVRDQHGGALPAELSALRELPGVGEYTAAAIASIVHGLPAAAVDGNVRRVLARLFDAADPAPPQLRAQASRLLDRDRPGDFNEAMMELGATICVPGVPRCDACPVTDRCRARAAGTAARRPTRRRRGKLRQADFVSVVFVDAAGCALLVRRPGKGLLAGMWEFPSVEMAGRAGTPRISEPADRGRSRGRGGRPGGETAEPPPARLLASLASSRLDELGVAVAACEEPACLEPVRHAFTHFRATYHPVVFAGAVAPPSDHAAWPGERLASSSAGADGLGAPARLRDDARMTPACASGFRPFALPVAQQKIAVQLEHWLAGRPASSPPGGRGSRPLAGSRPRPSPRPAFAAGHEARLSAVATRHSHERPGRHGRQAPRTPIPSAAVR